MFIYKYVIDIFKEHFMLIDNYIYYIQIHIKLYKQLEEPVLDSLWPDMNLTTPLLPPTPQSPTPLPFPSHGA